MNKLILLLLGVTFVTAFTLPDASPEQTLQISVKTDLEQIPEQPTLEVTIPPASPAHTLKTCWVRVWVVKFCTFVIPDQVEGEDQPSGDDLKVLGETESCDKLGCQMFCTKNHFKRGVCHKKGCECDFL